MCFKLSAEGKVENSVHEQKLHRSRLKQVVSAASIPRFLSGLCINLSEVNPVFRLENGDPSLAIGWLLV